MKILIYGAGVLGSLYAARLHEAGHSVYILARGRRLKDLQEHGIVLEDASTGVRTTTIVPVVETLAPEDAYDLVLVIMRKNQVFDVLPVLAANGHTPNVLFMMNNAAGPDAFIKALGRERVLMGFPGAGGERVEHVVRFLAQDGNPIAVMGEPDGEITPRLTHIADAFNQAGISVDLPFDIDAWLKTHVALVSPIANALYMVGGDIYHLARTRDAVVLMIRGIREGFDVLRALDIPVVPPRLRFLARVPEPLLVAFVRRTFASERAELAMQRHANAARDEMAWLTGEFQALAAKAGVSTPVLDILAVHLDPDQHPMPEGSSRLPMKWRSLRRALGLFLLLMAGLILFLRKKED